MSKPLFSSRRAAAAALIALAPLAACGSSGSKTSSGTTTSAPPTTTAAAATTTAKATTTTAASSSKAGLPTAAQAQAALLHASDLGDAFTDGTPEPQDLTTPEPCGGPNLNATFKPDVDVESVVDVNTVQGTSLDEELSIWADESTAKAAYAAGVAGLSCPSGTVSGVPVQLSGPTNVTGQVGGDEAEAFNLTAGQIEGIAIGVKIQQAVVVFVFTGPANGDTSSLPSPIALAKQGVDKIQAAGS